jgi:hypothetical protein
MLDTLVSSLRNRDFYLAQFWLAPEEPDAVLRVGSSDAAYWHAEVGSRRSRA